VAFFIPSLPLSSLLPGTIPDGRRGNDLQKKGKDRMDYPEEDMNELHFFVFVGIQG